MGNMSYCQFRNTLGDLQDCYDRMISIDSEPLSAEEHRAMVRLVKVCQNIVGDYADSFGQEKV